MKEYRLIFKVEGLNPYDTDLLVEKLKLIKMKLVPDLDIQFTLLKSSPNRVIFNHVFDDEKLAFEVFHILNNIRFSISEYERFSVVPQFNCSIICVDEEYGLIEG